MTTVWMARARDLMFPALADQGPSQFDRSVHERVPLPHTFKPRLSLVEAVVAVMAAFLRIFFGSLLFAVWGSYSLAAWSGIRNYFLRAAVLVPMFAVFLLSFAALMIAIAFLAKTCSPKRS